MYKGRDKGAGVALLGSASTEEGASRQDQRKSTSKNINYDALDVSVLLDTTSLLLMLLLIRECLARDNLCYHMH